MLSGWLGGCLGGCLGGYLCGYLYGYLGGYLSSYWSGFGCLGNLLPFVIVGLDQVGWFGLSGLWNLCVWWFIWIGLLEWARQLM